MSGQLDSDCANAQQPDASPPIEDAPVVDRVDASTISAPFILTFRVYPNADQLHVQNVNVNRLLFGLSLENHMATPARPMLVAGEYEPVTTQITGVQREEVLISINWIFAYNAMGDTATALLFERDPAGVGYRYHGRVEVVDQFGRTWVGYPTPFKGVAELSLRFVPGPCSSEYVMRRDNLCIR